MKSLLWSDVKKKIKKTIYRKVEMWLILDLEAESIHHLVIGNHDTVIGMGKSCYGPFFIFYQ